MKKNSIFILLLLCTAILGALDQQVNISPAQNGISLEITAENPDLSILVQTLEEGLRCGITFEIRLYEKIKAVADKFISSTVIRREGKWDPFSENYLISQNDEFYRYSDSIDHFFSAFFHLDNVNIPFEKSGDSQYYILCRVRIETLKFVPPFQLIAPGMGIYFPSTSWEKYVIM